jgi:DNA polymerase-1
MEGNMEKVLYIVDGHGLIYRAYYAFIRRPLLTTKGENTSALFGFMRMLMKLIKEKNPRLLVCVFDSRVKTFRHEMYPEYKAKRMKAPSDLISQGETIRMLVEKLGISRLEMEGYEADDLIGTLTEKARAKGIKSIIVSGDKDILQLVNDSTTVMVNRKGISEIEDMNREKVFDQWGVWPEKIIDLLALMGDTSDNIPGVRGIGKASAVKLVQEFGSVENIYHNIDDVGNGRTRSLLEEGRSGAFLSKDLVTIRKDVPVDCRFDDFGIEHFPRKEGIGLLQEKELFVIANELSGAPPEEKKPDQKAGKYYLIEGEEDFRRLKKRIRDTGFISVDVESTGKDPVASEVIGLSLSIEEGEGYYIPIMSKTSEAFGNDFLKKEMKALLEDGDIKKVGQNIKYDFVILLKYGIVMRGIIGDSMIAAYILDPQTRRYSLDDLAAKYLDYITIHYTDIVKDKEKTLLDYPVDEVTRYAGEDSDIALRLNNLLEKKLKEEKLLELYGEIEVPLLVVLGKMENRGVRIDPGYLNKMSTVFGEEIKGIEKNIFNIAGEEFNIKSTKQLAEVLFEHMKLPVIKRTKTGISTDESVLEELSHTYEITGLLLRYRSLTKLKSTYIDSLPALINACSGRIHTSFNQTIAATGRLSSSNPNLQNIPVKEAEGRAIRRAFIPEDGWQIVSADYSQIELRVLASLASDQRLIATFKKDGDIHAETASMLFNVGGDEVTAQQRQAAKTINFSIIYGISPFGLSKRLGIPRKDASDLIKMYFLKYEGVKKYFETVVENVKKNGYVETLLGRRRYVPDINSQNRNIFEAAKRVAINTPVQGTAADLIKKAMVTIDAELEKRGLKSRMLIQVHDELVFESPTDEFETLVEIVTDKMENAIPFDVPIKVNISSGLNWEEAH